MEINALITKVLNGTISAVKSVLPFSLDVHGRLIIEGTSDCVSKIGEVMFGMPLEGEMLESFAAELGNMLAGNIATSLATDDTLMDITPPTVLVGQTKMYGFNQAINLPVVLEGAGTLHMILMIEM